MTRDSALLLITTVCFASAILIVVFMIQGCAGWKTLTHTQIMEGSEHCYGEATTHGVTVMSAPGTQCPAKSDVEKVTANLLSRLEAPVWAFHDALVIFANQRIPCKHQWWTDVWGRKHVSYQRGECVYIRERDAVALIQIQRGTKYWPDLADGLAHIWLHRTGHNIDMDHDRTNWWYVVRRKAWWPAPPGLAGPTQVELKYLERWKPGR